MPGVERRCPLDAGKCDESVPRHTHGVLSPPRSNRSGVRGPAPRRHQTEQQLVDGTRQPSFGADTDCVVPAAVVQLDVALLGGGLCLTLDTLREADYCRNGPALPPARAVPPRTDPDPDTPPPASSSSPGPGESNRRGVSATAALRQRLLQELGWSVVPVHAGVWAALADSAARQAWLSAAILRAVTDSAPL
ncbi:MAG: hypothetical protein WDW36_003485 [Sanguina aurantia]